MRIRDWIGVGVVGLFIGGCAGLQPGVGPEAKAALAPAGKLRIAFLSTAPIYATKDSATGELKGVAPDLGKELARRVGSPYEPVGYAAVPAMIAGAKSGEWDVALMGINAERATVIDFSSPFMEVEQGYLVRAGAPIGGIPDIDKAGIRIGVLEKGGADAYLSGALKNAELVRAKSNAELYAVFGSGKVDVVAATKTSLFAEAQKHPGSRVLDGRLLVEPIGMGVPKGRDPRATALVGEFVEEAKAGGLVKSAIDRAGLRGVVVAPPK